MGDKEKAAFTREMETRLDHLREEFQQLELEQMRKGEVEARAKLADAKKQVARKRKEVEDRLDTVRRASTAAWEDARDGLEDAWNDLQESLNRARMDFAGTLEELDEDEEKVEAA